MPFDKCRRRQDATRNTPNAFLRKIAQLSCSIRYQFAVCNAEIHEGANPGKIHKVVRLVRPDRHHRSHVASRDLTLRQDFERTRHAGD